MSLKTIEELIASQYCQVTIIFHFKLVKISNMKKIVLFLILIRGNLLAQDLKSNQFVASYSSGVSYSLSSYRNTENVVIKSGQLISKAGGLSVPKIGFYNEINLDYTLKNNRSFGISVARQEHTALINRSIYIEGTPYALVFDNYKNELQKRFYDVHFSTEFFMKLNFSIGVFYVQTYHTFLIINDYPDNNIFHYVLKDEKQRSDNFGLSMSFNYSVPIKEYVKIGINAKAGISLDGIETINLAPCIRFSF